MIGILKLFCLILATIIGAGFSSGKEILIFFNQYSENILLNMLLSTVIFYINISLVLLLGYKYNINTYEDLIIFLTNKKIGKVLNKLIIFFIMIIFFTMISGFGVFLSQVFEIPSILGSLILVAITYITLKFNVDGIVKVSIYIVPAIILGLCILYINNTVNTNILVFNKYIQYIDVNKYFSGIIYSSYNIVIAIPIILIARKLVNKKRDIVCVSVLISVIIMYLILIIYNLINSYMPGVLNYEMPLLYISKNIGKYIFYYYILVIFSAIYSTAISTIYSIISKYEYNRKVYNFYALVICIVGLIVSNFGFSKLIQYGFSIIGWFGIIQTVLLISKSIIIFLKDKYY